MILGDTANRQGDWIKLDKPRRRRAWRTIRTILKQRAFQTFGFSIALPRRHRRFGAVRSQKSTNYRAINRLACRAAL
jgi:hypothetical protein